MDKVVRIKKMPNSSNLVIVKRVKATNSTVQYVVLRANEKEIEYLKIHKELPRFILQRVIDANLINITEEIQGVVFRGILEEFKDYDKLVYKKPVRKVDIRNGKLPIYRDYSKTKEEQDNIQWLVHSTPTAYHSWRTVIDVIGKTGIVIKINKSTV